MVAQSFVSPIKIELPFMIDGGLLDDVLRVDRVILVGRKIHA